MLKAYYLRFRPTANIDYCKLLSFYDIAEYNIEKKCFDTIGYVSANKLAERLNISSSTINRIFSSPDYQEFMSVDKDNKKITLHNYFPKGTKDSFVRLSADEVKLIRDKDDNLFTKYLIYIKYYCGYTKDNKTDFTAKQFLSACGYSTNSKNYLNRLNDYNKELVRLGLLKIESWRDDLGHTRNNYFYI